ncbi:MAG: O-antigen ligase family protein, partial [Gammaproteobacteria bacterium]
MKRQLSPVNDRLFVAFLTLLIWVPLPWASNRVFAWSLMEMAVFVIAMIWLWQYHQGKRVLTPAFRKARPVLIILAVWLVYTGFQVLPMPPQWVLFISPESNAIHALVAEANAEPLTRWITISVAPDVTSQAFVKSVAYALFFALTLLLVSSRTKLKWLAYSVVAAGTFQALYGIFMVLSGLEYGFFLEKSGFRGVVTGTFINRNNQANFLTLCMAVGVGLLLAQLNERSGRSWRAILRSLFDWALSSKMRVRFMLMVMAVALVMTHSRMGNTAFFLSLLIAGVISIILSKRSSRSAVMLLTSLVIIDLMIIGSMVGMDKVVERIEHTSVETENRDEVADDTLTYWSDYRWFGSGLGTYYTTYPRYRSEAVNGFYNHAHNDYLEMLAEVGLVGVALLGLLIIATIWIVFSVLLKRRDPWCRAFAFSALMSICAISLHATVDYNLQIPANSIYFMVVLALAWVAFG